MSYPEINHIWKITKPYEANLLTQQIRPLCQNEVLVRIRASALCGSDIHTLKGKHPSVQLPATIGHEFSGDVVEIGSGVSDEWLNKRVVAEPCQSCGKCHFCKVGRYDLCSDLRFIYRDGYGALAEYIIVKASSLFEIPDNISYDAASLVEPFSVALHAVENSGLKEGQSVMIIGDGAIGLFIVAACRIAGAGRIILAGHSDQKLEVSSLLGATDAINTRNISPSEWVKENEYACDVCFECVGNSDCLDEALKCVRRGGTVTVAGIYEKPIAEIDMSYIVTHQLHLVGTQGYCGNFPDAIKHIASIPVEKIITHTFPLSDLPKGIETVLDRSASKIKIIFHP